MKFNNPFKKNAMSDNTTPPDTSPEVAPDAAASEATGAPHDAENTALKAQFEAISAEAEALRHLVKDTERRALADYQNALRRADIREQQARDGQTRTIASSLAGVLDHFDQALKVDPAKATAADVLAGVSIVHGELVKALASFGVSRIEAKPGDAFDANAHQALMKMKVEGVKEGQVAMCFQTGYRLGEMIIRPAQVAVAE